MVVLEKAIIGSTVQLERTGVRYRVLTDPCGPTDACVYDIYPLAGSTARFAIEDVNSYDWFDVPGVFTADSRGKISAQIPLEQIYFSDPAWPYIEVNAAINGSGIYGPCYFIEGVNRNDIKLKMQRLTADGNTVNLANGAGSTARARPSHLTFEN